MNLTSNLAREAGVNGGLVPLTSIVQRSYCHHVCGGIVLYLEGNLEFTLNGVD